jgi:hypothetical protein
MNIDGMKGLIFRSSSGQEFGRLRSLHGHLPQELQNSSFHAFAQDESGNYFVVKDGAVGFWDHETSKVQELASSQTTFIAGLVEPSPATLRQGQVKSTWVSPELANLVKNNPVGKP